MSALPKAVQDQLDQADALQQQLYPADPAPVVTEPPADATPVEAVEPPSNVVELQQPQTQPEAVPQPSREETVEYWRSRFDTLRGKFDAEVPALHQQVREQASQLQQLAAKLEDPKRSSEADKDTSLDQDVSGYGEDMVEMVKRVASHSVRSIVAQEIAALRKEFGDVQAQVGNVADRVVQSEDAKFWAGVVELVPNWKQIDVNPSWIDWLDTAPEFSEETYRELAGKAIARRNPVKIAALVKKWEVETGVAQPAKAAATQAELQRQVAPSTSRASTPANPAERIWTSEEYERAYDVRNIKQLGSEEAARLVAEADRAVAEGRVRW